MPSFDVVSKLQWDEVKNAINQATREIGTRFDFKGTGASLEQTDKGIAFEASTDHFCMVSPVREPDYRVQQLTCDKPDGRPAISAQLRYADNLYVFTDLKIGGRSLTGPAAASFLKKVVPIETARHLIAGIPQSRLAYIWGAGHVPEFDQPERTARLIGAFMEHGEGYLVRRPA